MIYGRLVLGIAIRLKLDITLFRSVRAHQVALQTTTVFFSFFFFMSFFSIHFVITIKRKPNVHFFLLAFGLQFLHNHFPLGIFLTPSHLKCNHLKGQFSSSQPITSSFSSSYSFLQMQITFLFSVRFTLSVFCGKFGARFAVKVHDCS